MNLIETFKTKEKPLLAFELFPPRNEKAAGKLDNVIEKLLDLKPDYVSITFGAGGSTREGSFDLAKKLRAVKGLEVIAYFAGYGLAPEDIISILDKYKEIGVENIFVVRGDKPQENKDFISHPESFNYASDLIKFINEKYDFTLGAALYPEGHKEAESLETDLEHVKLKTDNGAQFLISQFFYDNNYFFNCLDRCKEKNIMVSVIPGIMPIYSVKMLENLCDICGATITRDLKGGIGSLPKDDKDAIADYGINFITNRCRELLEKGAPNVKSYFSFMNFIRSDA